MTFLQTLLVGLSTALLTGFLTLLAQYFIAKFQRENERNKALESEKRAAYKNLLERLYSILGSVNSYEGPDLSENQNLFQTERDLTIYASDKVFRCFLELRQASDSNKDVVTPLKRLILEIRKDVGHSRTTIALEEILLPILKAHRTATKKRS